MAKQDGQTAEACWLAIMDAFWGGRLPTLFVFGPRKGGASGRELMGLPSRDVLAGLLLGRVNQVNDESADAAKLSEWIAELGGWARADYQKQPKTFSDWFARDTRFGLALLRADFERWRGKRAQETQQTTSAPSGTGEDKRKRRRGPKPGALRRYEVSDKKLILELEQIMTACHISATAAARQLAEAGKIEGPGTHESCAKRLVAVYKRTKS
jgi:hypothetical protein